MSIENKQPNPEQKTEAQKDLEFGITPFSSEDMDNAMDIRFPVERSDKTVDMMTLVGLGTHPKTEAAVGKFIGDNKEGEPIAIYRLMEQQYALRDRLSAERNEAMTQPGFVEAHLGGVAIGHPEFYDGQAEEHRLTPEQLAAVRAGAKVELGLA